ncbi:VanZ family protein [Candidatus Leptofilum sp.]|uniref:VanZ family protein n=1 Tax=Candidatus Leptofilum sp. TaxID=3241576 RepID=UPI003B5CAA32
MNTIFSSVRERRLWFALGIVLAGIYATLGRAPAIAAALREQSRLRDNMFFALFVAMVVVAILFIRSRPGRAEVAVGMGVLIIYVTAWLRIGTLEERTHLFEYGLVAALVHEALLERKGNGRLHPNPALLALIISFCLGFLDETIQAILPNRVFDIRDIFFNTVAAVMIIGARWLLITVRHWVAARRNQ